MLKLNRDCRREVSFTLQAVLWKCTICWIYHVSHCRTFLPISGFYCLCCHTIWDLPNICCYQWPCVFINKLLSFYVFIATPPICQILAVCCGVAWILFIHQVFYGKSLMKFTPIRSDGQSDTGQAILSWSRFDCENQYPLYLPNTFSHFEVKIPLLKPEVWQRGILQGSGNVWDTRTSLAFPQVKLSIMQANVQTWKGGFGNVSVYQWTWWVTYVLREM